MTNAFIGQISMGGFNFAPRNTALCNGQTLAINQFAALFSLLGTTYGGNGVSTFQLPNLQGLLPVHMGQGPGLSVYNIGQTAGVESVALGSGSVPTHVHTFFAGTTAANSPSISTSEVPGTPSGVTGGLLYATSNSDGLTTPVILNSGVLNSMGNNQAHENRMPSLCISFFIYLAGIFPSQN